MKLAVLIILATLPAEAQVIEITDGGARTFTGPTRFTETGAEPIAPPRRAAAATLANAYGSTMAASAARQRLDPALIEAVAWRESRFRADALSPKGAFGPMQLMPATARALGVDARDPEQNIAGGAHYLRQMADRFGDWSLALAAYNAGPGAVVRFGGVPPFAETRAYVTDILARWQGSAAPPQFARSVPPANPLLIEVPAQ